MIIRVTVENRRGQMLHFDGLSFNIDVRRSFISLVYMRTHTRTHTHNDELKLCMGTIEQINIYRNLRTNLYREVYYPFQHLNIL